ncbi:MAG: hypothetical protein K0R43_1927 [Pseudoduganella sp.]|jgi:hypothetical protein|nr:hypothetical protein [Pseudoduganella sp.]
MAALTLSLLAHLALLCAVGPHAGQGAAVPAAAATPAVLTVRLLATPRHGSVAVALPEAVAAPAPASLAPKALAAIPSAQQEGGRAAAVAESAEGPLLTTPATVAEGLRGHVLLVPDVPPGRLSVHFWIDEQGAVERVLPAKHRFSDSDADKVLAALLKVRFHPARAGQLAVRSELQFDVLVANAASL